MPLNIGPFELVLILLIVITVFGVGRLPELGSALGQGIREFRQATQERDETAKNAGDEREKAKA